MDFLVNIVIDVPAEVDEARLGDLIGAERARAAELAADGSILRLWREPGRWANWGLWRASDEHALRSALETLPLHPFMSATIHPVTDHPSDPGSASPSERGRP